MGDRLVWGRAPREPALSEGEGSKPSKARQPPAAAATCAATFESNWITQELRRLAEAFDLACTISAEGAPFLRVLCARVGTTLIAQWLCLSRRVCPK